MSAILNGPRMPDDASVATQILYWVLTPVRLFRQRTAVNLVVSYVAMALITITLLLCAIVAMILWPRLGQLLQFEEVAIDGYLGEQARSYAQWLDPERLTVAIEGDLDPQASAQLDEDLQAIVAAEVPGFEGAFEESFAFRVAHVAILDMEGMVVASDDPEWITPGEPISEFNLKSTREVAARTVTLDGKVDPTWGSLYSLDVAMERTSASYPLIADDGQAVGVIVLEGNPIREVIGGDSRIELLRYFARQFREVIWYITIPAIVVAIPFGVWRARSISRRLERMAAAADAMAEGELDTRISIKQRDEIGRLAERFNEMAATIELNDRTRRAFISNVSHELRTPLSIIRGTVEHQLEHPEVLAQAQIASLTVIDRESAMLERMITDLFTLTRIGEQSLRLERKAFDLADLAGEVVGGIRDLAWSQSRVSVESLVAPDLPRVHADYFRVRQVLNNLLYNSLRHTPEGGLIVVQAKSAGSMVEVSVSDTGRGIPADEIEHVFERYYQAERGVRHDEGSGLGLSIVKQLVTAHGGEISVESREGEGTTFRFTLPQAP
ncbi:MAG: HAMP domain-containing histidine kinase [Chloroflexota bacterium]|nr:HAMP domain-containing histidine kinase [Chloroflexota bacterium]